MCWGAGVQGEHLYLLPVLCLPRVCVMPASLGVPVKGMHKHAAMCHALALNNRSAPRWWATSMRSQPCTV